MPSRTLRPHRSGATGIALAAALLLACVACAQEVEVARGRSTSRTVIDWKAYFNGDMRELTIQSETTTVYDPKENPPVEVGGVKVDLARGSPIQTKSTSRYVSRPDSPDYGNIRVESRAVTATGEVVETAFRFKERLPRPPTAVGPMDGQVIDVPDREIEIDGRTIALRATSQSVEILALLVAPTLEDAMAGRNLREVREPGARLVEGSLRVVSAKGEPLGVFAGDLRVSKGVVRATPK